MGTADMDLNVISPPSLGPTNFPGQVTIAGNLPFMFEHNFAGHIHILFLPFLSRSNFHAHAQCPFFELRPNTVMKTSSRQTQFGDAMKLGDRSCWTYKITD